ncbi:MAG: CHAT domain-containing protein [Treponema sp.]|nr:CHAT domain-containing protein [Treponema sp.]
MRKFLWFLYFCCIVFPVATTQESRVEIPSEVLQRLVYAKDNGTECSQEFLENLEKDLLNYKESQVYDTARQFLAIAYYRKGTAYHQNKDYDHALIYEKKALDIFYELFGDQYADTITLYNNVGMIYFDKKDYTSALTYLKYSLQVRNQYIEKKDSTTISLYTTIGDAYKEKGEYKNALPYYKEALELKKSLLGEMNASTANGYRYVGNMYDWTAQYDLALEYYEKALEIRKKVSGEQHAQTEYLYDVIGLVYFHKGMYDSAVTWFQCAADTIESKEKITNSAPYNNLGLVYYAKGDYDAAIAWYGKSLKILLETAGEKEIVATLYDNIGAAYRAKGDIDSALEYCVKANELYVATLGENNTDTAISCNNTGTLYDRLKDYENATKYYQRALNIFYALKQYEHPQLAVTFMNVGSAYSKLGEYDLAFDFLSRALKIEEAKLGQNHPYTISTYNDFGDLYYKKGDYETAKTYYEKVISCSRNGLSYKQNIQAVKDMLFQCQKISDPAFIRSALALGIDTAERARLDMTGIKDDIMALSQPIYYYGVHFEAEQGNRAQAFAYSESLRNRGFLDQIGTETALRLDGVTDSEREKIHTLSARIISAQKEIEAQNQKAISSRDTERLIQAGNALVAAEKELAQLDESIGKRVPAYAQLRNPQPVSIDAAQAWCTGGKTVLEYVLYEDANEKNAVAKSYCIVLSQKDIQIVMLDSDYDYATAVLNLRTAVVEKQQSLSSGSRTSLQKYRSALFDRLIQPVLHYIPADTTQLVIVPDGELSALPFDILGNSEFGVLGEKYSLTFSPSLSISILKENIDKKLFRILGLGNAMYTALDGPSSPSTKKSVSSVADYYKKNLISWENLSGTKQELYNLKNKIFKGEKIAIFEQEKASERTMKELSQSGELALYSQILIACHGYFNAAKPELSALVFSEVSHDGEKSGEDGYLTIDEISLLKMNAEFLNLSACQTGLSALKKGDGMLGLTRSCIVAGAHTVGVTLWEVHDMATCVFQEYLYGFIKNGVPYATAYQNAKQKMKESEEWSNPVYWAAFVLYE